MQEHWRKWVKMFKLALKKPLQFYSRRPHSLKKYIYLTEIIGLDGKILISKTVAVSSSTLVNINIKALASGSYFLRVKSAGIEQTALRFDKL